MGFDPNPIGFPGVIAGLAEIAMGVFVYGLRPWRRLNQLLALVLVLEGISFLANFGLLYLTDDLAAAKGFTAVSFVTGLAMFALYLIFLGLALETPLVRPFRNRLVIGLLMLVVAALEAMWFLDSSQFVAGYRQPSYATWDFDNNPTWPSFVFSWFAILTLVFALIASIATLVRAKRGTLARRRAAFFVAAFGLRDASYFVFIFLLWAPDSVRAVGTVAWDAVQVVFVLLLAYGILSAQLFDIDLRVRWTFKQGTLGGIFLAVFLVVSQLTEAFAAQLFGGRGWIAGAVAAGLLLFFLSPLQALSARLAAAATPHANALGMADPAHRRAFYEEQVRIAWEDGRLTPKECRLLETQRTRLGIAAEDALRIEKAVADAAVGGRPQKS